MNSTTTKLQSDEKTNRTDLIQLCDALSPIVRTTMLEYFTSSCCIATCKILRSIFAHYGYRARETPVTVTVLNPAMVRLIEQGIAIPKDEQERTTLFKEHDAWGVGIVPPRKGEKPAANGFGGHLVLNVGGLLVDASLQQAQRTERQIVIPPLLYFPAPAGFFAIRVKGQQAVGVVNGCRVAYRRIDNDGYRVSPNWREDYAGRVAAYNQILRLVSRRLA